MRIFNKNLPLIYSRGLGVPCVAIATCTTFDAVLAFLKLFSERGEQQTSHTILDIISHFDAQSK